MQWNASRNAGFSTAEKTWLPVNADYQTVNVENEEQAANSLLNTLRRLLVLRSGSSALRAGSLELIDRKRLPEPVLMFKRRSDKEEIAVVVNFSKDECQFEFKENSWAETFQSQYK